MKHLVLICVLISLMIVPFVLHRVPRNSRKSLSQHIAKDGRAIMMARLVFSLVAAMVCVWYFGWYTQTHNAFLVQAGLLAGVCTLAALAGLVPYYEGKKVGDWHNFFAWAYAYILPVLVGTFIVTSESLFSKIIITLCVSWQVWGVVAHWAYPRLRRNFLQFQLSYIAAFAVTLLAATYIG